MLPLLNLWFTSPPPPPQFLLQGPRPLFHCSKAEFRYTGLSDRWTEGKTQPQMDHRCSISPRLHPFLCFRIEKGLFSQMHVLFTFAGSEYPSSFISPSLLISSLEQKSNSMSSCARVAVAGGGGGGVMVPGHHP